MLTDSSKVLLAVSASALGSLLLYTMLAGDHLGIALLSFLASVAAMAGIGLAATRDPVPAAEAPAAEPPQLRPVLSSRPVAGGAWPAAAAAAVALVLLSTVGGSLVAGAGAALGLVVLVGWLASVSAERTGRRVSLMPVGIPVVGFFTIASLMFLMSRILLAVPELAATWIALAVAVVILGAASFFALRPAIPARTVVAGLALGGVLMTGGGLVAASIGERDIEAHHGGGHEAVEVSADNLAFDTEEIELHAGEVTIKFRNRESVPHNIAIYESEAATRKIFVGAIFPGPMSMDYTFTAPPPGTYFFRCDVHPNMRGTVRVA